jgi:hypothetical protein
VTDPSIEEHQTSLTVDTNVERVEVNRARWFMSAAWQWPPRCRICGRPSAGRSEPSPASSVCTMTP